MKKDYVPHQIHLTMSQIKKLGSGLSTNLKHSQMGADKGETVVMLTPQNARKMLTAYRKGKGMRLCMSPDEMDRTMVVGRGFKEMLKSSGKKLAHYGTTALGTAVGAYFGNPMAGMALGDALGSAAESAIDYGVDEGEKAVGKKVKKMAKGRKARIVKEAIEDAVEELPPEVKKVAKKVMKEMPEVVSTVEKPASKYVGEGLYAPMAKGCGLGMGLYGGKLKKGSPEMKERMAKLRAMKKGGNILDAKFSINDVKNAGRELLGKGILDEKFSINDIKNTGRDLFGRGILDEKFSINDIGRTGKELFGRGHMMPDGTMMAGKKHRGKGLYGGNIFDDIGASARRTFSPSTGDAIASALIHRGIPMTTAGLTGAVVGGITGNPLLGRAAGMTVGQYAGDQLADEVGRKTGRGMDFNTKLSKPYTNAMLYGKRMKTPNENVSKFDTNARVKASSDEMTLSPFQKMTSPAMNPFVPKYAFQQGGSRAV